VLRLSDTSDVRVAVGMAPPVGAKRCLGLGLGGEVLPFDGRSLVAKLMPTVIQASKNPKTLLTSRTNGAFHYFIFTGG
jgi:hypothetical protein